MARALITGCSTGIGRAAAVELTARGHQVVATARRPDSLAGLEVAERLALDVDDTASVQAAVAAAGSVDVLVNNAGWESAGPVEKADLDEVRAMFETNLLGAARMVQAVLPAMRERGVGPSSTSRRWPVWWPGRSTASTPPANTPSRPCRRASTTRSATSGSGS